MKAFPLIAAVSAVCLASAAQARTPIFIEYEGVKGESGASSTPRGGPVTPAARPERRVASALPQPIRQVQLKVRKCGDCNALHDEASERSVRTGAGSVPTANTPPPPPPPPRMSKNPRTVIRIDHHQPEANSGGVNVAVGDVTGDGRPQALLLPAVQCKGGSCASIAAPGQSAPAKPKPKPKPKPTEPAGDDTPPSETISLN